MMADFLEPDDDATGAADPRNTTISNALGGRSVVVVGMMGAGKSSIGRRLAGRLGLGFTDSDDEIEKAANLTIPEIFETYGEAHFRDGERKVIARLVAEGGKVVALGGGAFENAETRALIADDAISIWLDAPLDVLMERVRRRSHRPLLRTSDPEAVMRRLIDERKRNYEQATLRVISGDGPHGEVVERCLDALAAHLLVGPKRKSATGHA